MEKRQLTQSLLLLLFIIPFLSSADITDPEYGFDVTNGKIIEIDKKELTEGEDVCEAVFTFYVKVSNLIADVNNEDVYIFPEGKRVFLSYQVGNTAGSVELTTFQLLIDQDEYEIYITSVDITIDVSSDCRLGTSPNYILALRDITGGYYPIVEDGGEDDIFTCLYFNKTCNACDPPLDNCDPDVNTLPQWNGTLDISDNCDKCLAEAIPIIEGFGGGSNSGYLLSPNPFNTTTMLELNIEENSVLEIIIYDSAGRIISNWKETPEKGYYNKEINTSEWQDGIYYGQVKIGNKLEHFRMVKIE